MTHRMLFSFAAAILFATAAASIAAHPGHAHKVLGVVSVIHENHLEVKDADGKTTTFTLTDKTRIRRGKTVVKAADIKAGDRVVVVAEESKDKAGKTTMNVVEVQLGTNAAG